MRLDGPGVIEAGYFHGYDLLCNVGFNLSEVCIPEADEILHKARVEPDAAKQREMYRRISTLWYEDQPKIHVFAEQFAAVLSKDVTNYHSRTCSRRGTGPSDKPERSDERELKA